MGSTYIELLEPVAAADQEGAQLLLVDFAHAAAGVRGGQLGQGQAATKLGGQGSCSTAQALGGGGACWGSGWLLWGAMAVTWWRCVYRL